MIEHPLGHPDVIGKQQAARVKPQHDRFVVKRWACIREEAVEDGVHEAQHLRAKPKADVENAAVEPKDDGKQVAADRGE
eukprot:jgi/Chrpa1/17298/Chrysochromulina_OHIO_Genome00010387-RA